jgi:hypothetical protein
MSPSVVPRRYSNTTIGPRGHPVTTRTLSLTAIPVRSSAPALVTGSIGYRRTLPAQRETAGPLPETSWLLRLRSGRGNTMSDLKAPGKTHHRNIRGLAGLPRLPSGMGTSANSPAGQDSQIAVVALVLPRKGSANGHHRMRHLAMPPAKAGPIRFMSSVAARLLVYNLIHIHDRRHRLCPAI